MCDLLSGINCIVKISLKYSLLDTFLLYTESSVVHKTLCSESSDYLVLHYLLGSLMATAAAAINRNNVWIPDYKNKLVR